MATGAAVTPCGQNKGLPQEPQILLRNHSPGTAQNPAQATAEGPHTRVMDTEMKHKKCNRGVKHPQNSTPSTSGQGSPNKPKPSWNWSQLQHFKGHRNLDKALRALRPTLPWFLEQNGDVKCLCLLCLLQENGSKDTSGTSQAESNLSCCGTKGSEMH